MMSILTNNYKMRRDPVGEKGQSKVVTPYSALSGLRRRVAVAGRRLGNELLTQDSQS